MNRPWDRFAFEEALSGIASAGFEYVGFLGHRGKLLIGPDTPPAEADAAGAQVRGCNLEPKFIPCLVAMDVSQEVAVERVRRLVDHASRIGVPVLLEMGGRPENAERYFSVMRKAAPYAHDHGVTLALKPHGGLSATGDDCLRAMQTVHHRGYRICFDPGNLIQHAGKDPVAELPKLAPHVVAMCIKDQTGGFHGSVWVTPGDGDVDFPAIFKILGDHDFAGKPAIVETLAGSTLEEINHEAKRGYQYLTQVLAAR